MNERWVCSNDGIRRVCTRSIVPPDEPGFKTAITQEVRTDRSAGGKRRARLEQNLISRSPVLLIHTVDGPPSRQGRAPIGGIIAERTDIVRRRQKTTILQRLHRGRRSSCEDLHASKYAACRRPR